ncbi:glycosyltransferase [Aquipuribacter hungaricus]|uniref:Glucosyl-3-phosphoglycerate synthase n=1 Tax=Aquipuribacter hungaricus TaxID=545624 RepID=A0ABV7WJ58_9MICO
MTPPASVVVRAKDKADTITRTLTSLREQSVRPEIVVVDSGSTDGTLEIARRLADRVVEIAPEDFTYGGALNTGAAAASGDVHMAVSAHSYPYSRTWVEDSLALYARPDVAGTNSGKRTPWGEDIVDVYFQTPRDAVEHAWWGFSNHGSSWRATAWEQHPFRTDLPAAEDKEWSWRVLAAGWTIAYSPRLSVSANHRRDAGLRPLARRIVKERGTILALGAAEPRPLGQAFQEWWSPVRFPEHRHPMIRRMSPWRAVESAAAAWVEHRPLPTYPNPGMAELRRQVLGADAEHAPGGTRGPAGGTPPRTALPGPRHDAPAAQTVDA